MSAWSRNGGPGEEDVMAKEAAPSQQIATGIVPMTSERVACDCYIYKHSTVCSISAAAASVVRRYAWAAPLYWVNVIEQRPLSNWVAERYGVRHESPQLLKITNGEAVVAWSHFEITADSII